MLPGLAASLNVFENPALFALFSEGYFAYMALLRSGRSFKSEGPAARVKHPAPPPVS